MGKERSNNDDISIAKPDLHCMDYRTRTSCFFTIGADYVGATGADLSPTIDKV